MVLIVFLGAVYQCFAYDQQPTPISGQLLDVDSGAPLVGVTISVVGSGLQTKSDAEGKFTFRISLATDAEILFEKTGYAQYRHIWQLENSSDLGVIYLHPSLRNESTTTLSLSQEDLLEGDDQDVAVGFLQAEREVFYRRAAFDFGQAFFRVRGYDAAWGNVHINGIRMNSMFNGRPQWSHWGGLNDVVRNQTGVLTLDRDQHGFGNLLGSTYIDTAPSGLRPGLRLTTSVANRSYTNRLMATYTHPVSAKGFAYTLSASRRWASQGYMPGTFYDAYGVYLGTEFSWNPKHKLLFTGFWASQKRGRSSALTQEVYDLLGNRYNPYWGNLNGETTNSRQREIQEPFAIFQYRFTGDVFKVSASAMYQTGIQKNARVGYFNAPNPDPTYYRYLPSFYINSPIGANFENADLARQAFLSDPQWQWAALFEAHQNQTEAHYVWYDDVVATNRFSGALQFNYTPKPQWQIDGGIQFNGAKSENYAQIRDLLGAEYHNDIDPFSETANDMDGPLKKYKGDRFSYDFDTKSTQWEAFLQSHYQWKKWEGFISGKVWGNTYKKIGNFRNGRYPDTSLGTGETIGFSGYGLKSGLRYQFNGRHRLGVNVLHEERPPFQKNTYINPRENQQLIPNISPMTIQAWEAQYWMRLPQWNGRFTVYNTHFQNLTEVGYFFTDAGVGSDFVQQVTTEMDTRHLGGEIGVTYKASSAVDLSMVASVGKFTYANNSELTINFDTAGSDEDFINPEGVLNLGTASLKGLRLPQGPQTALSVGCHYRDPKYWWLGVTANYLGKSYIALSRLAHTQSFTLDPETGQPFTGVTQNDYERALRQSALPEMYFLNLTGGKSWRLGGNYLSLFVSVNNLFDGIFRTGGYEQNRNGNYGQWYQDNLSGQPSFGPKYWFGYGRTYFVNLAYSLSLKKNPKTE
ncbi:hypothetical protein B7P33_16265 [Sediminicola luteus]|uniref:TonB-dependent receptor n=2 Tax=Sediminicola luteus TaxID=319238 RepID=A0A2A4G334_9FLAO|nr:hypothetical protein B7P33_16265 [Sediminicola luteus]